MTERPDSNRQFTYRATLPGWAGLLLAAPLLLVFFSLALTLVTGGVAAALVLPLFFRRRPGGATASSRDHTTIDLDPSQYTRVEPPPPQLPHK